MYAMNRVNRMGQNYTLVELENGHTQIRLRVPEKSITVPHDIHRMDQAWYDWTMGNRMIQYAFHFLNADEREFIMTGITAAEWKEMFTEKETD